ncbi:MAG: DUF4337 domain-containing protein [Quisquiliibacterium sp.]
MSGSHGHVDASNKKVALLISVLALVLALSETLGKSAQTTALTQNIEAANLWNFFQAKTIRMTLLRTAAEEVALPGETTGNPAVQQQIKKWRETAERYDDEPSTNEGRKQLVARAKKAEQARDKALAAYHHFEMGSAALQIAIVLASASIIVAMNSLVWAAIALGGVGVIFGAIAMLAPTAVHLF